MSYQFRIVSALGMAMTLTFAVFGTSGAKARPQDPQVPVSDVQNAQQVISADNQAVNQPAPPVLPAKNSTLAGTVPFDPATQSPHTVTIEPTTDAVDARIAMSPGVTLAALVDSVPIPDSLPQDIECMASAVYFEARSESLAGQLAVGRVIVARTESGRFPDSYCGVVKQHSQFSFLRGGAIPAINRSSHTWQNSVRIALIAHRGAWKSPAEGALYFHSAHIKSRGRQIRIAQIDNHVFYR